MRIDIVSKEFPPEIYGGAGVHVAELAKVLAPKVDLKVRAFGAARDADYFGAEVTTYETPAELQNANGAVQTLGTDLRILNDLAGTDLIHTHTWYANMAGHLGGLLHDVPHILSAHSLEPFRPWKAEQLGGGYALSSWAEHTTYQSAARVIAVSEGMRQDILTAYPDIDPNKVVVVHNGIDTAEWEPRESTEALDKLGVDINKPILSFVGRVTRQKGVPHLLRAIRHLDADVQVVLALGAADTPELAAEVDGLFETLQSEREGVHILRGMTPREELQQILTHSTVFACPSIYEPLGIVNLEAMACGTAVVASAVGGIPEVVDHGTTGLLVSYEAKDDATGEPVDPEKFASDFAAALTEVLSDQDKAKKMGEDGRQRAIDHFSWETIADKTVEVYRSVLEG